MLDNRNSATEEQQRLNRELVNALFSTVLPGIYLMVVVRDKAGKAIDLKVTKLGTESSEISADGDGHHYFLKEHPAARENGVFGLLLKVAEGVFPLNELMNFYGKDSIESTRLKALKFLDGLLISREDVIINENAEINLIKRSTEIDKLNSDLHFKNIEQERLHSELEIFNSLVAREFKEMLHQLYTGLEFLIANDARLMSDSGKASIRRGQANIQKMKLLTEDVIAYSAIQVKGLQKEPVDLRLLLEETQQILQDRLNENNASIEYKAIPSVNGYPGLLAELVRQLILNSLKYRKEQIPHTIQVTHSYQVNPDHKNGVKNEPYLMIQVKDTGNGFDPKEADNLFTLKGNDYKRSGIGLAICRKIMDLHEGFIRVECDPDCTTIQCFFPVA